jgi:hypothetical protein
LYTNISEEHTASIFRAEVRRNAKWMVYMGLEVGSEITKESSSQEEEEDFLLISPFL